MSCKTLGEMLFDAGFTRAAWYPQNAFATNPPRSIYGDFDPAGDDLNSRYDSGGDTTDVDGTSPLRAKGNLPGAFHGREATWFVEAIAKKHLPMEPGWSLESDPWAKEDLKFVLSPTTLQFAYDWFVGQQILVDGDKPAPEPTSSKSPLDQRVEELRSLLVPSRDLPYAAVVFLNSLWPATKVFAIAALRLYRAALSYYEGKSS